MKRKCCLLTLFVFMLCCTNAHAGLVQIFDDWALCRYVNEFKEDTDELYITPTDLVEGVFSNSAVTDRTAYLSIALDLKNTTIFLSEYSADNTVKQYSETDYLIEVNEQEGIYETDGIMYENGDRIYINNAYQFDSVLRNNTSVDIYIQNLDYKTTTYLFSDISLLGFKDAENALYASVKNGLNQDDDGIWRYYENGQFVEKTGIVDFGGGQFFVANGLLCSDANGLAEYGGQWYFLANGQIQTQYTGLALYDDHWFYLTNGLLDTNLNGLVDYDGSKFIVAAGQLIRGVNGLWQNTDGTWYFLADSQVVTYFRGMAEYDGNWFYIINGRLATEYTGNVVDGDLEFYVVNGQAVK